MALQKTDIPLMVNGGIDTKTDKKLVSSSKMIVSENVDYRKLGAVKKSEGTIQLTNTTDDSVDLSGIATKIFSHNDELVVLGSPGQEEIYSYDNSQDQFVKKSGAIGVISETDQETSDSFTNAVCSVECTTKSFKVTAVNETNNEPNNTVDARTFRLTRVDYSTGHENSKKVTNVNDVRQFALEIIDAATPYIFLVYTTNSWGTVKTISLITKVYDEDLNELYSTTLHSYSTGTYGYFDPSFDTEIVNGKLFVACTGYTSADNLKCYLVTTGGVVDDTLSYTATTHNIQMQTNLMVAYNNVSVACCHSGSNIYIAYIELNDAVIGAPPVARDIWLFAVSDGNLNTITKSKNNVVTGGGQWARLALSKTTTDNVVLLAHSDIDQENNTVQIDRGYTVVNKIDWTGASPSFDYIKSIGASFLYSKFLRKDLTSDDFYLVLVTTNVNQNKVCLVSFKENAAGTDVSREIVSRFGVIDTQMVASRAEFPELEFPIYLNRITKGKDDHYYFPFLEIKEAGKAFSTEIFKFDDARYITSRFSQSTHISSGVLKEYNGREFLSSGFTQAPTITSITTATDASNPIASGTYLFYAIYKYYDVNGEVHYSGLSNAYSVTSGVAFNNFQVSLLNNEYVLDLNKEGKSKIELYMSVVDTSTMYKVAEYDNDTTYVRTETVYTADPSVDGILLYTTGGVLQNLPIPPFDYIGSGLNRMFGVSSEDKNKIFFSQKRIIENSIEWSDLLYFRVDNFGKKKGYAVGIENLDDKMIILKNNCIAYIAGDGPLPTGEQNTFTQPANVSQAVGCSERQSIVATPKGVMFKGKKGIYIVDRSLSVQYIGAEVEQYNSETIVNSDVSTTKNEVYFQTANRLMVYNYLQDKWSTNTYLGGKSICIWKDNLAVLKSDGRIYYQDSSVFTDNGSNISMKVASPWYKLKGITGYGRLYELFVLGEYKSNHTLNIRVYYDYDETDYDDYTFTVTSTNIYEYQIRPSKQKCQAFKIEVWDTPTGGSKESFELTGLTVRVGVKPGLNKLSSGFKG